MSANALLEEVIAAHGDRGRWKQVQSLEASLSSAGFAFASHGQGRAFIGLKVSVEPQRRRVVMRNFGHPDWRGIWTPNQVEIRDDNDRLVAQRQEPRAQFKRFVKNFRWDKLDMLYFGGYALWNYLSFPFILESPGVTTAAAPETPAGSARRLLASFDAGVPTHSAEQAFHIDAQGLLMRHDYTADVIGSWAKAANCCLASEVVGGFRFYTRRKVYPRMDPLRAVLPFPLLVWIEIDDLRVNFAAAAS